MAIQITSFPPPNRRDVNHHLLFDLTKSRSDRDPRHLLRFLTGTLPTNIDVSTSRNRRFSLPSCKNHGHYFTGTVYIKDIIGRRNQASICNHYREINTNIYLKYSSYFFLNKIYNCNCIKL